MADSIDNSLDTSRIKEWRSIITLIVFVLTNIVVLFPFHIPICIPRLLVNALLGSLSTLRITPPRLKPHQQAGTDDDDNGKIKRSRLVWYRFPINFVTAPLIADLFLLAILAIGRTEVHDGTIGANNISPIDIMAFFITLAYIAISIDASGLIRYLAFKVLQWGGDVGHRLFFYLYAFFFGLSSFVGNDPVILSGTAFLAYMTRVSQNIQHPRAWIHTQFAIANIGSAILVSSNPTNLVLAGAFQIRFITYSANMIVPVVVTAIVLFPFLLYIVFANEAFIPSKIEMHELPEEARNKTPVNPNIPNARGNAEQEDLDAATDERQLLSLEEIMNPFLDKTGAAFGAVIMAATLITLLAVNAASQDGNHNQAYWVTLPAAFVQFCWDVVFGWRNRHQTRQIAREGREEVERARALKAHQVPYRPHEKSVPVAQDSDATPSPFTGEPQAQAGSIERKENTGKTVATPVVLVNGDSLSRSPSSASSPEPDALEIEARKSDQSRYERSPTTSRESDEQTSQEEKRDPDADILNEKDLPARDEGFGRRPSRLTVVSILRDTYRWCQETFPTCTAVVAHLPFALIPFALSMFVLVQALVTKGWVPVFAYGWDHWIHKTGTIGAIGGMAFLSVILCNFAGTNIGTTILLSRVIQSWQEIHRQNGLSISNRTFWATVYSMALGVNYGAFSAAFSASLAGLLWRDILARKHIRARSLDFARVNLPIIAISMVVGCVVLVGQVYITRDESPYDA